RPRPPPAGRPLHRRGRRRSDPAPVPAHRDALVRFHPGRGALDGRHRSGSGQPAGHRHGGVRRDDGLDAAGHPVRAGVLRGPRGHERATAEGPAAPARTARGAASAVSPGGRIRVGEHGGRGWLTVAILTNCRRAMAAGARVLLVERYVATDPHEALPVLISDVEMLVNVGGRERTTDEYATLLARGGFRLARAIPLGRLPGGIGVSAHRGAACLISALANPTP